MHAVGAIAAGRQQLDDLFQLGEARRADGAAADQGADLAQMRVFVRRIGRDKGQNAMRLVGAQARALGEIAGLVLAALAQQRRHAFHAQPVELVDGAQHDAAPRAVFQRHARWLPARRPAACDC